MRATIVRSVTENIGAVRRERIQMSRVDGAEPRLISLSRGTKDTLTVSQTTEEHAIVRKHVMTDPYNDTNDDSYLIFHSNHTLVV